MTTKKTAAFERFAVSANAIATAIAEFDAPRIVIDAKAALLAIFRDNGIEAKHFTAPKGDNAQDNEWVSARAWLWNLAAYAVKCEGVRLDAEGVAKLFDESVANAALICGQSKSVWKNRINNQVGDKWGKKVFGEAVRAESKAAEAAQAEGAEKVEVSQDQKEKALLDENKTWFQDKLQGALNRTHKEVGAYIDGDMVELQRLIAACAAQVGVKLKAPN